MKPWAIVLLVVFCNAVTFQFLYLLQVSQLSGSVILDPKLLDQHAASAALWTSPKTSKEQLSSLYSKSSLDRDLEEKGYSWDPHNPLSIPKGHPPNLPSVRDAADSSLADSKRDIYGGKGDKKHLGGFTNLDLEGVSPSLWSHLITKFGVHSFIDVGCGKGVSTRWFLEHNVDVLCVEGSHDAVQQSYLPPERVVEHDFSRGPWWPEKTYDLAWSVEFLEHVSRHFQFNYMTTFRKAAIIAATSSRWGGWHHTEVHEDEWWIQKFESYGFRYSSMLSKTLREVAIKEKSNTTLVAPNGKSYSANHIIRNLKVFINPAVASLPQHNHLFPEHGCFEHYNEKGPGYPPVTRPCDRALETPLAPEYEPLPVLPGMHQKWHDFISSKLNLTTT